MKQNKHEATAEDDNNNKKKDHGANNYGLLKHYKYSSVIYDKKMHRSK